MPYWSLLLRTRSSIEIYHSCVAVCRIKLLRIDQRISCCGVFLHRVLQPAMLGCIWAFIATVLLKFFAALRNTHPSDCSIWKKKSDGYFIATRNPCCIVAKSESSAVVCDPNWSMDLLLTQVTPVSNGLYFTKEVRISFLNSLKPCDAYRRQ